MCDHAIVTMVSDFFSSSCLLVSSNCLFSLFHLCFGPNGFMGVTSNDKRAYCCLLLIAELTFQPKFSFTAMEDVAIY